MKLNLIVNLDFDKVNYNANDQQNLKFTLTNDSVEMIHVLKWNTPFEGMNNDIFLVEREGKYAVYMGRLVKRGSPKPEDYMTIEPKNSSSTEFDLSKFYDAYEPGEYNVEYRSHLLDAGIEEPRILAQNFLTKSKPLIELNQPNIAKFTLLERRQQRQIGGVAMEFLSKHEASLEKAAPTFNNCDLNRQGILNNALTEAEKIANESRLALRDLPENRRATASRYQEWFGNYDKQHYDKVINDFEKIWDALANKTITFNCSFTGCDPNWYAYVQATNPYEIFLCNLFWSARLKGTDSQAGTLIHEISHFNVVAGTSDIVYGQANCRQLAISKPSDVINNADSHEYFAENHPWLTMKKASIVSALSSRGPGSTSLYVIGKDGPDNDGQVWTNFFPDSNNNPRWNGWTALGPNVFPIGSI
jgi:peptidyl-Lys metalloendopeptidase